MFNTVHTVEAIHFLHVLASLLQLCVTSQAVFYADRPRHLGGRLGQRRHCRPELGRPQLVGASWGEFGYFRVAFGALNIEDE